MEQRPRQETGESGVKLHVSKIPEPMTLASVVNLFSQCGTLTNFTLKKSFYPFFKEAVIEYATLSEARSAIRMFHQQDPRFLDVVLVSEAEQQYQVAAVINGIAQLLNNPTSSDHGRRSWVPGHSLPGYHTIISLRKFNDSIALSLERLDSPTENYNSCESTLSESSLPERVWVCAIGGEVYSCKRCGFVCQEKDWPKHKRSCVKILSMDSGMDGDIECSTSSTDSSLGPKHVKMRWDDTNNNKNLLVQPIKRIEAGMVRRVCLSHADSLQEFYVQLMDNLEDLETLQYELNQHVTDNSPGLKEAVVGTWCCKLLEGQWTRAFDNSPEPTTFYVNFSETEQWARALIISPEPIIFYVDYGKSESATLDELKELPSDLCTEPPFAFKVFHPKGFKELVSPTILRFLNEEPDGRWVVEEAREVSEEEEKEEENCEVESSLDSEIEQASLPVKQTSSKTTLLTSPTPRPPYFKDGGVYEVKMQEACSLTEIYVTKVDNLPHLEKLQKDLNSAISDSSPQLMNLAVGNKCAVKYGLQWCRAMVKEMEPLTVCCVDYGNKEICQPTDVKELPHVFKAEGLLTVKVRLPSNPTKEQLTALRDGPVEFRVMKKDGSHWLCEFATDEV